MYIIRITNKNLILYILNHYNNILFGKEISEARIFHSHEDANAWWNIHRNEIPKKLRKGATVEILHFEMVGKTTVSTSHFPSAVFTVFVLIILVMFFIKIFLKTS